MKNRYNTYKTLRDKIDNRVAELEKEHNKHMKCKAGCDLCCMDYNIFPVEFYSILSALKQQNTMPNISTDANDDACVFLSAGRCNMYEHRPIICSTHGLPLLFMNDENWELSACELNFTEFNMENFTEENTYAQDRYNSELFMLNKKFIADFDQTKYAEFDLLPMKDLAKHFQKED